MRKEIKYNDVPFVPSADCSHYEDCREDAYQQGREDAIDEFRELIIERIESRNRGLYVIEAMDMAEKMKGERNDRNYKKSAFAKVKAQKENFGFMDRFTVDENFVVKEALEKQIPMKPKEVDTEAWEKYGISSWLCSCGRVHRNDFLLNYCSECGQKIDWSDDV